ILDGLVRVPDAVRDRIQPAGVICVVDAEAGAAAVGSRDEARAQAASADRVMLAKLDVASPRAVEATHAILDEIAPHAERAGFPSGEAGARAMTAWVIEPRALRAWSEPRHRHHDAHGHGHHHNGQLTAVSFCDDAPLVGERVLAYLASLGDRLVRAKGFVHLAGDARRGFVERAGIRTELRHEGEWAGPPRTELVLIGDDLDEATVHRALWACRTAG
ncbi:MAG TPA: GTP-binding protein, partial [Kofleriaceae bacterium]|nr:GTP-binding protein [Kofleriaceae bacterium]